MPVQLTNPGVYIQELESGSHTITGVATSITAFIGRARKGPVAKPTTIFSFSEFERTFGGAWEKSYLASSVRDYFLNGGSTAVIVRAEHSDVSGETRKLSAESSTATLDLSEWYEDAGEHAIELKIVTPGTYGNSYGVRVTRGGTDPETGEPDSTRFLLEITSTPASGDTPKVYESFPNETVDSIKSTLDWRSVIVEPLEPTGMIAGPDKAVVDPAPITVDFSGGKAEDDLTPADYVDSSTESLEVRGALTALDDVDLFNLLVIPPTRPKPLPEANWTTVVAAATELCGKRRAFLLVDAPEAWNERSKSTSEMEATVFGPPTKDMAIYAPWLTQPDPTIEGATIRMPATGAVAGILARTDTSRGVWKAPAGVDAGVRGAIGPARMLKDSENGVLYSKGINCLMVKPNRGLVVWGTRTTMGFDGSGNQWKFVPVRRLFNYIEETLFRNTQWVVFELNDAPLWRQIKLDIKSFLNTLFRQGAFQGETAAEAYYVACGWDTMTQADIDNGIINIEVGFAPVKPAEFVVISFRQKVNTAGLA